MRVVTWISLWWVFLCQIEVAAELAAEPVAEPLTDLVAEICIIGVGAKPPRRYSETGVMQLPLLEDVPPNRLYYRSGKGSSEWSVINVTFNSSSAMAEVPAERVIEFFRKEGGKYEKYMKVVALEKKERRMIFLTVPQGEVKTWSSTPDQHSLVMGSKEVSSAKIVMKNLSRRTLNQKVGNEESLLAPMQRSYYRPSEKGLCRIVTHYLPSERVVFNSAIRLLRDRGKYLYVFYDADPRTNAGSAVGVFRMILAEDH